jgi:hypothetical protein
MKYYKCPTCNGSVSYERFGALGPCIHCGKNVSVAQALRISISSFFIKFFAALLLSVISFFGFKFIIHNEHIVLTAQSFSDWRSTVQSFAFIFDMVFFACGTLCVILLVIAFEDLSKQLKSISRSASTITSWTGYILTAAPIFFLIILGLYFGVLGVIFLTGIVLLLWPLLILVLIVTIARKI